jgi:hypothetical protein
MGSAALPYANFANAGLAPEVCETHWSVADGVEVVLDGITKLTSGFSGGLSTSAAPFALFDFDTGGVYASNSKIFGMVLCPRVSGDGRAKLRTWLDAKAGLTL